MYKQLSSRIVFEHPRITLIEDEILLPNGDRGPYLRKKRSGHGATVICRNEEGRILLEKDYSYVLDRYIYQFPGGGIGLDEDPEAGANRELMEEIGLRAEQLALIGAYHPNHRMSDEWIYVFLGAQPVPATADTNDPYECEITPYWLTEAEIDNLIRQGEIVNGPMLSAWAMYKARGSAHR